MDDVLNSRECNALQQLSDVHNEFLIKGELVGIGDVTLASLVDRGLAETGPSRKYGPQIGWRITDDGWRCMYGETLKEIMVKPDGVKSYPFLVWRWPVDPDARRRRI